MTSWLPALAALLLVACGLSLLLERALAVGLPWTLRPGLGAAAIIVLAQFGTLSATTAPWTLPAIALLGLLGWVVGALGAGSNRRRWFTPEQRWGLFAGALTLALYALPFLVRGEATWAGYIKLDDTATFMAMADWAFEHGRIPPETAVGSYAVTIQDNLGAGYPIGSFTAAALMALVPGQDVAWTIQPGMAFGAACLVMALYELGRRTLIDRPALACAAAVCAGLSALLLGYYLWGGVKELAAAPLIALGPAIALIAVGPGAGLMTGLVAAAVVGVLGLGAGIWLAPVFLLLMLDIRLRRGRREAIGFGLPAATLGAVLALPAIFTPAGLFSPLQGGLTADTELGNLAEPVGIEQAVGLWPALDFRQDPAAPALIGLLSVIICVAAAWAVWQGRPVRRAEAAGNARSGTGGALAALLFGGLVATAITVAVASPWVGAKALATYSPFLLFGGLCGLLASAQSVPGNWIRGRAKQLIRIGAGLLTVAVFATAVWGAAKAYLGISFAPRAHYEELAEIGDRFAGQGPALSTEISISGPRHFLRELDADAAGGRRSHQVLTRQGEPHPSGTYLDIPEIRPDQLRDFSLLILRRTPFGSRPPSEFDRVWQGRFYEVWRQAPEDGTGLYQDLQLGGSTDPGGMPACEQILGLSQMVGPADVMRAAPIGSPPIVLNLERAELPEGWPVLSSDTFSPLTEGVLKAELAAPTGRYRLWVGGEVYGGLKIEIDGKPVGELRGVVNNTGGLEPLQEIVLEGPRQHLTLSYSGADLHPGSGFQGTWSPFPVGPVVLEPLTPHYPWQDPDDSVDLAVPEVDRNAVFTVPAARYRNLCGRRWDWIEARTRLPAG